MRVLLWPALLTVACGPKNLPLHTAATARAELNQAWERELPMALQARFYLTIQGPDTGGTTQGAILFHSPDKARLDVQTPLMTPMFLLASDGHSLDIWLHRDGIFLRGDDALVVLEQITGGTIALEDVLTLMSGGLPLEGERVAEVGWEEDEVRVRLEDSEGISVDVWLDPQLDMVRLFEARRASTRPGEEDALISRVEIPDYMLVDTHRLPEEMRIELPSIGWGLELEVHTWDELGVIPDVFTITPPAGAEVYDLVETVRALAESQGVHPAE